MLCCVGCGSFIFVVLFAYLFTDLLVIGLVFDWFVCLVFAGGCCLLLVYWYLSLMLLVCVAGLLLW